MKQAHVSPLSSLIFFFLFYLFYYNNHVLDSINSLFHGHTSILRAPIFPQLCLYYVYCSVTSSLPIQTTLILCSYQYAHYFEALVRFIAPNTSCVLTITVAFGPLHISRDRRFICPSAYLPCIWRFTKQLQLKVSKAQFLIPPFPHTLLVLSPSLTFQLVSVPSFQQPRPKALGLSCVLSLSQPSSNLKVNSALLPNLSGIFPLLLTFNGALLGKVYFCLGFLPSPPCLPIRRTLQSKLPC